MKAICKVQMCSHCESNIYLFHWKLFYKRFIVDLIASSNLFTEGKNEMKNQLGRGEGTNK